MIENIVGGVIGTLFAAALVGAWRWLRHPLYLPLAPKDWTPKTKQLMHRAGFRDGELDWKTDTSLEIALEMGCKEFRAGPWPRRREVRSRNRDGGFSVLVWRSKDGE